MARPLLPAGGSRNSKPDDEVAVLAHGVDRPALVGLAADGAVDHLVVLDRALPAGEVAAVEDRREAVLIRLGEPRRRLGRGISRTKTLRHRISPPCVCSWMGPRAGKRTRAIPEVLHPRPIDDELAVQVDRGDLADLDDPEGVPLPERLVGVHERILPRCAWAVVPQAARALVGAVLPGAAFLGGVPDLHLR
jgi:hypothetical protein